MDGLHVCWKKNQKIVSNNNKKKGKKSYTLVSENDIKDIQQKKKNMLTNENKRKNKHTVNLMFQR